MEYNSNKELLVIPEYGRHVQNLIRHARTIENKDERQHFAERIIGLMMQMHPQNRILDDFRDKLWRHLFQIAEYEIDVMPPSGIRPRAEDKLKKPEMISYPAKDTRFKHYGNNVQKLIAKAIEMEDGAKKDTFVEVIGSYMKLAYRTWNKEHYVSDDIIVEGLEHLSKGRLKFTADASLDNLTKSNLKQKPNGGGGNGKQRQQQGGSRQRNGGGGRSGGRRRRR
jgi:hypothetical protein